MYTPRAPHLLLLFSASILCGNHAVAQRAAPPSKSHVLNIDSTYLDNPDNTARVVFSKVVKIGG